MVSRFTDDPARKLSHQFFLAAHETKIRTAEPHRKTQLLAFANRDVDAHFTRGLVYSQRNRITAFNDLGLVFMHQSRKSFNIFYQTKIVRAFNV